MGARGVGCCRRGRCNADHEARAPLVGLCVQAPPCRRGYRNRARKPRRGIPGTSWALSVDGSRLRARNRNGGGVLMRTYDADIVETAARNGILRRRCGAAPITATGPDPEHDLCFAMVTAGLPDGEIQFWRGSTPSLLYRSVHRTAGYRVELGADFPYRLRKRREGPTVFAQDRAAGSPRTAKRLWPVHRATRPCRPALRVPAPFARLPNDRPTQSQRLSLGLDPG